MPTYIVSQGDCLSSIAKAFGLPDWRKIYNDASNADFRSLRPDPNVILPGDQLFVPDLTLRIEDRPTDQKHLFVLKAAPTMLRIVLLDEDQKPLAGTPYKLEFEDGVFENNSGADGLLEQEISPDATRARLSIQVTQGGEDTGYTWDLQLGALDPDSKMTGIQARLNNLGYNTGPVDGVQGVRTTEAIKDFQEKYGLDIDGVAGPITRGKLVEVHGC